MFIKKFKIRNQLLIYFFLLFVPLTLVGSTMTYHQVQNLLRKSYERELENTTESLTQLIKTVASVSVRNRLRAIAEKNLDIAEHYYNKYRSGLLTRQQAVAIIEETFMSQSIGLSGYVYCLNSNADLLMHPIDELRGSNVGDFNFVQKQIELKDGYIEYEWQNPGEIEKRPKALYMSYFKSLDWIISVSSYREEFDHLVEVNDFKESVLSYKFGRTGYVCVFNLKGKFLVHPWLQGKNMLDYNEYSSKLVSHIMEKKKGNLKYFWQNPNDIEPREKIIFFDYLPEYGWFVASSNYIEEVEAPLTKMFHLLSIILIIIFALAILFTFIISTSITHPMETLMAQLELGARGNYSIRMDYQHPNELGKLSQYFNDFMDRLEKNHTKIEEEIQKQMITQAALKKSELKLMALFNQSFQLIGILTPEGKIESINETATSFVGCLTKDVIDRYFWETPWWIHDPKMQKKAKESVERAADGQFTRFEATHLSHTGDVRIIDYSMKPVLDQEKNIAFLIPEGRDITDLKAFEADKIKLETQLHQAQKMESIGTLAGGIAHNFNNILMNIQGRVSLIKMDKAPTHEDIKHLTSIESAVQRAVTLTRQLLAFARGGEYRASSTNLNTLIAQENRMFGETRKEIRIHESFDKNLWTVTVDQGQIQQVLLNLYVNAWQAMDRGGDIHVQTSNKIITTKDPSSMKNCGGIEIPCGAYVIISVTDTGTGMDKKTAGKIFDPFFTTKPPDQGTGLGLASVYGIIKKHGGVICLVSEKGKGSTFDIYLPATPQNNVSQASPLRTVRLVSGEGSILLVDDEKNILDVGQQMLERLGYQLFTAENGKDALEIYRTHHNDIDLVIIDMIMPGMDGEETFSHLKKLNPKIKVLLASGNSMTLQVAEILKQGGRGFIQKPFTLGQLSEKIKTALS